VVVAVNETIVPVPCGVGGSTETAGVVHAGSATAYCMVATASDDEAAPTLRASTLRPYQPIGSPAVLHVYVLPGP
jgi:hypothetical protein